LSAAAAYIDATAIVEPGVEIGAGSAVWDHAHIRAPARLGRDCIVGGKASIAYGVHIGDRVKINSFAYLCTGVTLEDGVMVAAGAIFTNDRSPRATTADLAELRGSGPDEHTRPTRVRQGATIGARAVIGSDLEIGRFAMVGMGAVVTRTVPDFHLVVGCPARSVGCVCRCGEPLLRFAAGSAPPVGAVVCRACGRAYQVGPGASVVEDAGGGGAGGRERTAADPER
jgi:UDP-2-acetamido-3-amino-2,3-dideoxy-glucuronate N-acetyltransferase